MSFCRRKTEVVRHLRYHVETDEQKRNDRDDRSDFCGRNLRCAEIIVWKIFQIAFTEDDKKERNDDNDERRAHDVLNAGAQRQTAQIDKRKNDNGHRRDNDIRSVHVRPADRIQVFPQHRASENFAQNQNVCGRIERYHAQITQAQRPADDKTVNLSEIRKRIRKFAAFTDVAGEHHLICFLNDRDKKSAESEADYRTQNARFRQKKSARQNKRTPADDRTDYEIENVELWQTFFRVFRIHC